MRIGGEATDVLSAIGIVAFAIGWLGLIGVIGWGIIYFLTNLLPTWIAMCA